VVSVRGTAAPPERKSEWTPGKYMSQAIVKIMAAGTALEQRSNFGWNNSGLSFLGAFLQPKAAISFNIHFDAGSEYAFVGAA